MNLKRKARQSSKEWMISSGANKYPRKIKKKYKMASYTLAITLTDKIYAMYPFGLMQ